MNLRICIAAFAVVLVACINQTYTSLDLTIIQPPYNGGQVDTIHSDTIPVEGQTTVGASILIGATSNPSTPVTLDASGHFLSRIIVSDQEGDYSIFVKASMPNHEPILESRSVYYKRP